MNENDHAGQSPEKGGPTDSTGIAALLFVIGELPREGSVEKAVSVKVSVKT